MKLAKWFSFLFVSFFAVIVFGQDVPLPPEVSNQDFLGFLIQSLGGFKGASTIAIVGLAVQILMKFIGTPWANDLFKGAAGPFKLLIVAVLSLVGGVAGLMAGGLSLGAAVVHSATLMAFMVLFNQVYKQFLEKK